MFREYYESFTYFDSNPDVTFNEQLKVYRTTKGITSLYREDDPRDGWGLWADGS